MGYGQYLSVALITKPWILAEVLAIMWPVWKQSLL